MPTSLFSKRIALFSIAATVASIVGLALPSPSTNVNAACCYFAAKDKDVNQPSQKAFICWDEEKKIECFTVQPKFEGNAEDFGMVIPTPGRPKLDEMPRDFFKELAVFTILKKRENPQSRFLWGRLLAGAPTAQGVAYAKKPQSTVKVLEAGIVGSLDYKIVSAEKADDLFQWLKDNKYNFGGDQKTLDHYIQKKWFFTTMKIDAKQMKKNGDGSFAGEVTPTRFEFASEKLVYPLKITQLSVKDTTEALLYIQAPWKADLPGDMTYQYQWIPSLQASMGCTPEGLPGKGGQWLASIKDQIPGMLEKGKALGFGFTAAQRPQPNKDGRVATTLEWAKMLGDQDIKLLSGEAAYTETLPDLDAGLKGDDDKTQQAVQERMQKDRKEHPGGYLIREAPKEDLEKLKLLKGHLQKGMFLTKVRKTFTKGEMEDDLLIVQAKLGNREDKSEYEEILPTSPP